MSALALHGRRSRLACMDVQIWIWMFAGPVNPMPFSG